MNYASLSVRRCGGPYDDFAHLYGPENGRPSGKTKWPVNLAVGRRDCVIMDLASVAL